MHHPQFTPKLFFVNTSVLYNFKKDMYLHFDFGKYMYNYKTVPKNRGSLPFIVRPHSKYTNSCFHSVHTYIRPWSSQPIIDILDKNFLDIFSKNKCLHLTKKISWFQEAVISTVSCQPAKKVFYVKFLKDRYVCKVLSRKSILGFNGLIIDLYS